MPPTHTKGLGQLDAIRREWCWDDAMSIDGPMRDRAEIAKDQDGAKVLMLRGSCCVGGAKGIGSGEALYLTW